MPRNCCAAALILCTLTAVSEEPPVVPVGLDAYRMWDRWPQQRIGVRAYMRSTYDRAGGNEGADASHFLFQLADDYNVTLDVAGPGVLYFARYNHWHGSPWHYVVDGADHVIRETSTADPLHPKEDSVFIPQDVLPTPLTWTWAVTKGADLMWVPIPFERSFRMAYGRTCYGTGYYIYHQFVRGTPLSRPIVAWDGKTPPDRDVLDLINRAGTDIAPAGTVLSGQANGPGVIAELRGPAVLRAFQLDLPREGALAVSDVRLRITWDGRPQPSVDAPLPLFFGAGTLYNRDNREYFVKAFPVNIRFTADRVHLACYFPMPFFRSAKIELVGGDEVAGINWSLRHEPVSAPVSHLGYFHATYRDHPHPEPGQDLVLLNTRTTEGGGDWSGSFVGTSFIFSHDAVLNTLEGDPRFFFDDSLTPQAQGTGTEEWGGGGDYWGGRNMTLPFAGHPAGAKSAKDAKAPEDLIESAYRFLLADLMPFGRNALIRLEHGGTNESREHYETVTYWYGLPAASLVQTDVLQIADVASEQQHGYESPDASQPYELTSSYEWGKDPIPQSTDHGRTTKTWSQFRLKIDPNNLGIMLRRKLDYAYPNQRADVFVSGGDRPQDWKPAGAWYAAGSNTCVYSRPKSELDPPAHAIRTSDRRFRDDEFLLPLDLTRGRSSIWVKVQFTTANIPLFPGQPLGEQAWSEMCYTAYCFVMPRFTPPPP